jgi:hypothetical protein
MGHPMTKIILFFIVLSAFWGHLISIHATSHADEDPWTGITFYVR